MHSDKKVTRSRFEHVLQTPKESNCEHLKVLTHRPSCLNNLCMVLVLSATPSQQIHTSTHQWLTC